MSNLNEIELKLEKAKAYKTLLTHKFFKKENDVTQLVQAEILKFVENQLANIFGLGESKVSLDKDDVQILKLVAGKLLSKTQDEEEQEEQEEQEQEENESEESSPEPVFHAKEQAKPVPQQVLAPKKKTAAKATHKQQSKTAQKPVFSPIAAWHSKIDLAQVGAKVDFTKAGQPNDILEGQKGPTVIIDRERSKFAIYLNEIDENTGKYREKILKHAIQQQYVSSAELPNQGFSAMPTPGSEINVPMAGLQAIVDSHVTK